MRRTPRTGAALTGVLLAGGALAAALPGSDAGATAAGPMRDGHWAGTMSVGATADFSSGTVGLVAEGSGHGAFHLLLTGGVGSGDFSLDAVSSASLESAGSTGNATAVGSISGELQGIAAAPILQPLSAHFDVSGSVTVSGLTVPFEVPIDAGAADVVGSTLVITSSSCTYASGTWAHEMRSTLEGAGAQVTSFQGSWAAEHTGAEPGAADAALTDLLGRGEAILTAWLATGTFDDDAMELVLVDAEHVAAAGPVNDACPGGEDGAWASPLAGMLDRLLTAIASSPSTTAEVLRFGVAAGLRTGVLPSIDAPLEGMLMTKAGELLELAVANGDTVSAALIAVAADSMHWTDLSAAATGSLAR